MRRPTRRPTAAASRPDQRGTKRFTLILRAAKLVTDQGEYLCVLRDISTGGLKLRLFHPLELHGTCTVELAGGERLTVDRVWQRGLDAGFRFAGGPLDISALLLEAGPFPKRSLRLVLGATRPALLHDGDSTLPVSLRDISQHGLAVDCAQRLPIGRQVRIETADFGRVPATVRWRRGATYGLVLARSFRLDELAHLVAALQAPPAAPEKAPRRCGVNH